MDQSKEKLIRNIVKASVSSFAYGFHGRHIGELNDPNGTINQKIHNFFISALGEDIQYFSALVRSLDSSMGNFLENMAIQLAENFYEVTQHVEGSLHKSQTHQIASLLESYKRRENRVSPSISDYQDILNYCDGGSSTKRHESDYYLKDNENNMHYLVELKIGGDLDNKKARSEKEALMEQYAILANSLGNTSNIKICFATAYNRFGEGQPWTQTRVRQFFSEEELLISSDFWNFICKDEDGFNVVIDEYKINAQYLKKYLDKIKESYLG